MGVKNILKKCNVNKASEGTKHASTEVRKILEHSKHERHVST